MPRLFRRFLRTLLALVIAVTSACATHRSPPGGVKGVTSWAVAYGASVDQTKASLDLLIAQPHTKVIRAPDSRGLITAYLSVGEAARGSREAAFAQRVGAIVGRNAIWNTFVVNVREVRWTDFLFQQAQQLRRSGFSGLLLDTVDAAVRDVGGPIDPSRVRALCRLIGALRESWPQGILIANGSPDAVSHCARRLDAIMVESLFTGFDPHTKASQPVRSVPERQEMIAALQGLSAELSLPVLVVEYLDWADPVAIRDLRRQVETLGFSPYVGPWHLAEFWPQR